MQLSAYLDFAVDSLLQADLSYLTSPTDYDTSWAARLLNPDGSLAYPGLLQTLVERQHADGSWGGQQPNVYDRLVTTLSVVTLLARYGERRQDKEALLAGQRYIWRQVGRVHNGSSSTVGFEMIVPTLIEEGLKLGLQLPHAHLHRFEAERREKMKLLPLDKLSERITTALFSLEAFANADLDTAKIENLLANDGSVAGSPSATAWLLGQDRDWRERYPDSTRYIETLLVRYGSGLPSVAPYDLFARSWVLHNLYHGGLLQDRDPLLRPHYAHLKEHWHPELGVGASSNAIPDSDDTAMVILALVRAGYDVDGRMLLAYEREDYFAVFEHERHPSISANLHILEALDTLPKSHRPRVKEKILRYVLGARQHGTLWTDKWHASAYYPTSQAIIALSPHVPHEMERTLDWLLFTQQASGGWGQYAVTVEETALSLLALLFYGRNVGTIPEEPVHRAVAYLLEHEKPFAANHPELWIAKALYAPTFIIQSVVLAALNLYQETYG
jgi:halimadienyl-diphosphate synthase